MELSNSQIMATLLKDVQAMLPIDPSEMTNISARLVRAFELYADGKGVTDVAQKGPFCCIQWE